MCEHTGNTWHEINPPLVQSWDENYLGMFPKTIEKFLRSEYFEQVNNHTEYVIVTIFNHSYYLRINYYFDYHILFNIV